MFQNKILVKFNIYQKGDQGERHLFYIYKKKIKKQFINKVEIGGADMKELLIDYSTVKQKKGVRSTKNLYLEITVYGQISVDKRDEILKLLNEKFFGHKIAWISYYDERSPYTIFLISWCHPETGKAIRLSTKDKKDLQYFIKNIHNLETAKKVIENVTSKNEQALNFIQKMLDLYQCKLALCAVKIKSIEYKLPEIEKIEDVKLKRMRNFERYGFNLCFYPIDLDCQRAVFLDNIKEEQLKDFPLGCVVVKISDDKYQVHIPIPPWINNNETLRQFQAALIGLFQNSKKIQTLYDLQAFRYLVGFVNHEYEHKPNIIDVTEQSLLGQGRFKTLDELWIATKELIEREKQRLKKIEEKREQINKLIDTRCTDKIQKHWDDFYQGDADEADFRYALYLNFNCGFTDTEIKKFLLFNSKDICLRKPNVEKYLDLVILKKEYDIVNNIVYDEVKRQLKWETEELQTKVIELIELVKETEELKDKIIELVKLTERKAKTEMTVIRLEEALNWFQKRFIELEKEIIEFG